MLKAEVATKDPGKRHFYISLAKSAIRIAGCIAVLVGFGITWLALAFLAAEALGIAEEL
jgi:hypothetical protein